jgi:2-amino-4-hydroxy-6-hydroxymethyldihydropteridine diphosphokinase
VDALDIADWPSGLCPESPTIPKGKEQQLSNSNALTYFRHMATRDIYLCVGGNLGDREGNMEEVLTFIEFNFGDIQNLSPIVESDGWHMSNVPKFLNQVIHIKSELSNKELLVEIKDLEQFYGRTKKGLDYQSREMDVDVLLIDQEIIEEPELIVPHPRMTERRFVLYPLSCLVPDLIHPTSQLPISKLLADCTDENQVVIFEP